MRRRRRGCGSGSSSGHRRRSSHSLGSKKNLAARLSRLEGCRKVSPHDRGIALEEDGSMRGVAAACWIALALLAPLPAWSQDVSQDGQPGMGTPRDGFDHLTEGEARRGPGEAVRRDKFDEAVEKMFASADSDRNGMLTLAELRAVIETRKDAAIRGRFASVDANRDQSVSFAEFNQWQRSLGSAVLTEAGAAVA